MKETVNVLSAWDVETDPANPRPNIWPECPTCDTAFTYGRALSMGQGWVWCWMRTACKHKSQAVLMTENGPYTPSSGDSDV